jgi:hypothetical protein
MKIAQQIVGVNQRLGNTAVPNMQGTTRCIYDSQTITATTDQSLTFYQNVNQRAYPLANVSSNRFEVGESLAIQGIQIAYSLTTPSAITDTMRTSSNIATANYTQTLLFNLYIGNQRVIKDLDLTYSRFGLGEAYDTSQVTNVFRFETPIVIPPQIEFYATLRLTTSGNAAAQRIYCALYGQGTLLNTKSTF